jgi:hypothetical protein
MRKSVTALLLTGAVWLAAEPALAIPAFARRYKVECHFCHDIYPKLTLMGQRFKERGFRMEREEDFDVTKWAATVPISVRAFGNHLVVQDGDDSTTGYAKGISAGNLGSRFSYWVDDAVLFTGGDDNVTHIKPDNAWGRVEIVRGGKLYAKGGRFELDLPFTQTRTPHLFSYDIYFANTGFETDGIGRYQEGLEVGGDIGGGARWSAAIVQRVNRGDQVSRLGSLYLRASKRFVRNRVGGFAYFGKSQLAGGGSGAFVDNSFRLGADGDLWLSRLNLYGVYLYGRNDNSIATPGRPSGTGQALTFHGGFVQADYHLLDPLALTLRANFVNEPPGGSSDPKEWQSGLFPGAQVWLIDDRLKLSFEYGFLNNGRRDFGAVQAEIAF